MRSGVLLLAAYIGQAAAHADPNDRRHGMPRLAGARRFLSEVKGKRRSQGQVPGFQEVQSAHLRTEALEEPVEKRGELKERQNKSGKCGKGRGTCAEGYCCSYEGWCGLDVDYCTAPDCQINYGSGCDGNQKPSGVDTSTIERPKLGKVQYGGVGIYDCVNKGDIALTFDDGPWNYTDDLLDKLAEYEAKATFFITGNNLGKGPINDPDLPWMSVIQRMAAEGHQIASHTWSHENYSQLTKEQYNNQIIWNEIAFNDILGYFPTYMRPPYSICPTACQRQLADLGYHAVYFDLDTEGYLHDDASQIQTSKDIWDDAVDGSSPCQDSYLQIEHDIHYQTVYNLTEFILESLFDHGYRSVTVGQCLGDPPENWYRAGSSDVPPYNFNLRAPTGTWACLSTRTGDAPPTSTPTITTTRPTEPTSTLAVSSDGTCGTGVTCIGSKYGNCCSENGWCGASIDYCGSNCNAEFGTCTESDTPFPRDDPLPTGPGTIIPDDPLPTATSTATAPAPTSTLQVSVEGDCGGNITCEGSEYGNCCSERVLLSGLPARLRIRMSGTITLSPRVTNTTQHHHHIIIIIIVIVNPY
ncbi:carbohydrate-binding module family 18 [Xylariomycetidae sp. FL0641]|nr:carbohydrate-binding module family 18 [Xylariomycetidae sp. FL0641]